MQFNVGGVWRQNDEIILRSRHESGVVATALNCVMLDTE